MVAVVAAAAIGGCQAAASQNRPTTTEHHSGHHDQPPGGHHDQRGTSVDDAAGVPAASESATRRWLARQSSDPDRVLPAQSSADPRSVRRPRRSGDSHLPLLPVAGRHRRVLGPLRGATDLVPDRDAVRGHPRDGERPRPTGDDRQQPVPLFHSVRHYLLVALATGRRLLGCCTPASSSPWPMTCSLVPRAKWCRRHLRPAPPGPPIYFAGDSTAAGPEWAWDTYHATSPELQDLGGVPGRHRPCESRVLRLAASSARRRRRSAAPARDLHGQRQRRAGPVRRRRLPACREPVVEKGLCRQGCRDHGRARARRLQGALDRRAGNAGPPVVGLHAGDGRRSVRSKPPGTTGSRSSIRALSSTVRTGATGTVSITVGRLSCASTACISTWRERRSCRLHRGICRLAFIDSLRPEGATARPEALAAILLQCALICRRPIVCRNTRCRALQFG